MAEQPLTGDDPPAWAVEGVHLMAQAANPGAVVRKAGAALAELDWRYVPPELDARAFRRFFAKVSADGQHRLAHLHLMSPGAARWNEQLKFRDALRADAALRDEYASVKGRLARSYPGDRERYGDEKAVFVTRALRVLNGAS